MAQKVQYHHIVFQGSTPFLVEFMTASLTKPCSKPLFRVGKLMEIEVPSLGVPTNSMDILNFGLHFRGTIEAIFPDSLKKWSFSYFNQVNTAIRPENAHHLRFSKHLLQLQSLPERSLLGVFLQAVAPVNRVQLAQLCCNNSVSNSFVSVLKLVNIDKHR